MKILLLVSLFVFTLNNVYAVEYRSLTPFIAHADFHRTDHIINLKQDRERAFILDDYSEGLELFTTRKVYASAGVLANFSQAVSASTFAWGTIGLFPLYNSYANFYHRFDSLDEMDAFEIKLPENADVLDTYRPGDAAFFTRLGGVSLHVIAGMSQVGLGPKVFLEGGFSFYVEKKENDKVYVEMRNIFTHNYSLMAGTWIAYAELTKLIEKTRGVGFELDLKNEKARQLYRELVQEGRIDRVQSSSRQSHIVSTVESQRVTNKRKIALTTPILPLIEFYRSREVETTQEVRTSNWAGKEDITRVVNMKKRSNRFFGRQRYKETIAVTEVEKESGKRALALIYEDKGNRFNFKKLERSINKLLSMTGLRFLEGLEVPDVKEKLGVASVELHLTASEVLINKMIEVGAIKNEKGLARFAQGFWKNPVTFNLFYRWIKKCGGDLEFKISGERLAQIEHVEKYQSSVESCELDGFLSTRDFLSSKEMASLSNPI